MMMNVVLGDFVAFISCILKFFENKGIREFIFDEHPFLGTVVVSGIIILGILIFENEWFRD